MLIAIKKHYVKYARIRAFCDPYFTVGPKILSLHEKKGQTKHLFLHILRLCKLRHGEFKESLVTTIDVCQLPSFVFPNHCDLYLHP